MTHGRRWRSPLSVGLALLLLFVSACTNSSTEAASKDSGEQVQYRIGFVGKKGPAGDPVRGGTLTMVAQNEAKSLDPTKTISSGESGGTALAAVYGVLIRYNPETDEYQPWLAEALEPTEDYQTWTLQLRKDVRFSDGTLLDAQAVVDSVRYYLSNHGYGATVLAPLLTSMEVTGPRTVVFHLEKGWDGLPQMLAHGAGMIVAPSARQGSQFRPIGAGPFKLVRHAPGEEMVLEAREDYWRGTPYLEKLRFIWLSGGQARLTALTQDAADLVFLMDPQTVEQALRDGHSGFMSIVNQGIALSINTRQGRPGERELVRRAIGYAIDPEVIYERAFVGAGLPGKELFGKESTWHVPEEQAPPQDLAKAKKLLQQAKANGYDGKIQYLAGPTQSGKAIGVAVKAMLEKAGFEVTMEFYRGNGVQRIFVKHDWDLVRGGAAIPESDPFWQFYNVLHSGSPVSISGYGNPKMEELLVQLRNADTDEETLRVIADIEQLFWKAPPYIPLGATARFAAWDDNVHGVVPTASRMLLFGAAWLGKSG